MKTQLTGASVASFIEGLPDPERRKDARAAVALLRKATGARPEMWGTNIVGFGRRRLAYASGREIDWMVAAFAPRGDRTTFYLTCDLDRHRDLLGRLGKHQRGKGCLHVKRLSDVDAGVLEALVRCAVAETRAGGAKEAAPRKAAGKPTRKVTRAARPGPRGGPRTRK
jgi:hypothetical protein